MGKKRDRRLMITDNWPHRGPVILTDKPASLVMSGRAGKTGNMRQMRRLMGKAMVTTR